MRRRLLPLSWATVLALLMVGFQAELEFGHFLRALVLWGPGSAVAQEKTAQEKKSEMKSDTKMERKGEKKPASKSAGGTVKSASADRLVVAGKMKGKDEEWTFAVDSKTTIRKGGKAITAADVKAGDPVQINYTEDAGKMMASSVMVKAAPAKKAEKVDRDRTWGSARPGGPRNEPEPGPPADSPGYRK